MWQLFNSKFGFPEDAGVMEVMELYGKEMSNNMKGMELHTPANVINLQRCVMTLNGHRGTALAIAVLDARRLASGGAPRLRSRRRFQL